MRKSFVIILALLFSATLCVAQKLPKRVDKARQSVTSILTYNEGELKGDGTAFFVGGNGDVVLSYMLANKSDSIAVIDTKGKVHPVLGVVGLNNLYDCVRVRVAADKKIPYLPVCHGTVPVGDELYMLAYGKKNRGEVKRVSVVAVDSFYSHAYYTLDIKMQEGYSSLPLVNANGELVAIMQPMTAGDTCSYAISSTVYDKLVTTSVTYGKGRYDNMGIRTLLPDDEETALSCMYMQSVLGDSLSFRTTVDDFIAAFPRRHEGYMSRAEYMAVYCRDMDAAEAAWKESLTHCGNAAEVYFNKAKVIYSIVHSGDTVSHSMLSVDNVLSLLDSAIAVDNQPLYVNYKADVLLANGRYAEAYDSYVSLTSTSMRSADVFARASQCQGALKNYDIAVELMDSAINCLGDNELQAASPYILTRALLKFSAGRFRESVFDYNMYEDITGAMLGANFYYLRYQAEVNGKMYQQALNDLEKAISIDPGNFSFYLDKGILCYRVNMLEEGAETLEMLKSMTQDIPDVYYLLGCIYSKAGKMELAEENLLKAISMNHPDAAVKLEELKKK